MKMTGILFVPLLLFFLFADNLHLANALEVDGVDVTHFRTRRGNESVSPVPFPTLPPPCDGSAECPDVFCPVPIVRCDCCKTCKQDCRVVFCARPPCPNPIIPPGECCGQCEADCTLVDCAPLDCPIANQTHKPGACCPTCIEDDEDDDMPQPDVHCPDTFCPNPVNCSGCLTCRQDCRVVSCLRPSCPNPIVPPGECCGTCNQDCRLVRCARPLCSNPTHKPGECCPTCDESVCNFKGCVSGGKDPSWQPDQCTRCRCSSDKQSFMCVGTPCAHFDCGDKPFRTVPGNCCPTCDQGIPDDMCGVVPREERIVTVRSRGRRFTGTIVLHKCDKSFIQRDDTIFSCVPTNGRRTVRLSVGRRQKRYKYRDVTECNAVPWSETCDLFVP
ncbi:uncharacterized protein DDB_G0274171-like [Dysidea avara]|uniref:uncharacterized protein DDB_G0274171-like n=1 Tax=Dysidea avara TaxID=196820 RepID=UPI003331977E